MAKNFTLNFAIAGALASSFTKSFDRGGRSLRGLRKEVADTNKKATEIKGIVSLREEIRALEDGGDKTSKKLIRLKKRLEDAEKKAGTLGKSTGDLTKEMRGFQAAADLAADKANKLALAAERRATLTKRLVKQSAALAAVAGPLVLAGKAAIGYAEGVKDVADEFGASREEAKVFRDQILSLSTEMPLSTKELLLMANTAAEARIPVKDLGKFLETTGQASFALGLSTEETARRFAALARATGKNSEELQGLSDSLSFLQSNTAAKGRDVLAMLDRIAGATRAAGFTTETTAGMLGALSALGVNNQDARRGVREMLLTLQDTSKFTEKEEEALRKLGLTSSKLGELIEKDANGAIYGLFKSLERLDQQARQDVLGKLFGKNNVRSIGQLVGQTDLLAQSFNSFTNSERVAGSALENFRQGTDNTASALALARNQVSATVIEIGETFRPEIEKMVNKFTDFTRGVFKFVKENPKLVKGLSTVAAIVGGLIGTMTAITAATLAWNFALAANPAVLIITAITAALAGLAYGIAKVVESWDSITGWFGRVAQAIGGGLSAMWGGVHRVGTRIGDFFVKIWEGIKNAAGAAIDWMASKIDWIYNKLKGAWEWVVSLNPFASEDISVTTPGRAGQGPGGANVVQNININQDFNGFSGEEILQSAASLARPLGRVSEDSARLAFGSSGGR